MPSAYNIFRCDDTPVYSVYRPNCQHIANISAFSCGLPLQLYPHHVPLSAAVHFCPTPTITPGLCGCHDPFAEAID